MCLQLWVICSIQCTVHLFISFHSSTMTHTHYSVHTFFSNWCKTKSATCSSSLCLRHQGAPGLCVAAIMLPPVPDLQLLLSLNHSSRVSENPYCHLTSLSEVFLDVCFKRWPSKLFLFFSLLPGSWRAEVKMGTYHNTHFQPQRVCTVHWSQTHRNHTFKIEAGVGLWQPWYQPSAACALWFSRCCK